MDLNLKNIVYTHSSYFDVLDVFLEQQTKFGVNNYTIFSDIPFNNSNDYIFYKNESSYSKRLQECLNQIDSDMVLYQHEDMFLYDLPNISKINKYANFLKESSYSFIRLSKTGDCILNKNKQIESLFEIHQNSPDFFAVQPTIWKTKDFIKFLSFGSDMSIWDLEINSSSLSLKSNISGLLHFENEEKRGGHYDSSIWPYVATAIVKGKWNQIEYREEISKIDKIKNSKRQFII